MRSVKDQAFALCGAASGVATLPTLFGWAGFGGEPWTKEQCATAAPFSALRRVAVERAR